MTENDKAVPDIPQPSGKFVDGGVHLTPPKRLQEQFARQQEGASYGLPGVDTLSDALLQAVIDVKAKAKELADLRTESTWHIYNRAIGKHAAITRLLTQPNPTAKPTKAQAEAGELPLHSYASAELVVESDPEYHAAVSRAADAAAKVTKAEGAYDAAKVVATALANAPVGDGDTSALLPVYERRLAEMTLQTDSIRERCRLLEMNATLCREGHVTRKSAETMATTKIVATLTALRSEVGNLSSRETAYHDACKDVDKLIDAARRDAERSLRK